MHQPLLIHINYFEPHFCIDEVCRSAAGLGMDGVEFRRPKQEDLEGIARAVDRYSLTAISFGSPGVNLVSDCEETRRKELDDACQFFEWAKRRLPLTTINLLTGSVMNCDPGIPGAAYWRHGSAAATDEQWESVIKGLKELGSLGIALGVSFALETHPCLVHDTIPATQRLVEAVNSPAVGILWDHTNLLLMDESPLSLEASYAGVEAHLGGVHLKNFLMMPEKGDFVISGLSDGVVNIRQQIAILEKGGYAGPLCIESPRPGDRRWFARQDAQYLKSLLSRT